MPKLLAAIQLNFSPITSFLSFFDKLTFDYTDFLDILIISLLIFFVIALFTRTKTTPIVFGIVLLGILYGTSIFLNLRLTQTIFSSLFSVLFIILAIVLQKELRRFFEIIGLVGLRRQVLLPAETIFRTTIRTVEYLSKHKMGAIIVFPGNENLEGYLEGGITLDGRVSRSLLISIFDKTSPGHDGAIIIEGDRVKKFGVHLPLAESAGAARKYGTRHRAALGLAESTDAIAIVISEESGDVSLAYNKKMTQIEDMGKLEDRLKNFQEEKFPKEAANKYIQWLKPNIKAIIASVIFAVSLWAIFTYQSSLVQRKFVVPIQFKNLNKEYVVEDFTPEDLIITFTGRESDFRLLEPQTLKANIDLSKKGIGWHRIIVTKESLTYPSILTISKIDSDSVKVYISDINIIEQETEELPEE